MLTEKQSCSNPASDAAFDRDTFLLKESLLTLSEEYNVCDENGQPILYVQRPVHQVLGGLALLATLITFFAVFALVLIALNRWVPRVAIDDLSLGVGFVLGALGMPRVAADRLGLGAAFALGAVGAILAAIMMRPKRHTTFYRDSSKKEMVLRAAQNRRFQPIVATYTIFDAAGRPLAQLRKNRIFNFARKRWDCLAPDGTSLCVALEESYGLALVRQALERVFPYVATNFVILRGDTDTQIGEFNRKATILNHHVLDLKADPNRSLDRRIALALGVMLDSGERG